MIITTHLWVRLFIGVGGLSISPLVTSYVRYSLLNLFQNVLPTLYASSLLCDLQPPRTYSFVVKSIPCLTTEYTYENFWHINVSQRCVVDGIYAHDLRLSRPVLYTLSYYHYSVWPTEPKLRFRSAHFVLSFCLVGQVYICPRLMQLHPLLIGRWSCRLITSTVYITYSSISSNIQRLSGLEVSWYLVSSMQYCNELPCFTAEEFYS